LNFTTFIEKTDYSGAWVAHCLLYQPKSKPSLLADLLGYKPTDFEKAQMRKLIAGRGDVATLFPEFEQAS
jgi:hypothetical protein